MDNLLGHPTIVMRSYVSPLSFFVTHQTLQDGRVAPRQKYIRGLALGRIRKIYSDVRPPVPYFKRVKKWEKWPQFSTLLAFGSLSCPNRAKLLNYNPIWISRVPIISIIFPTNFDVVRSTRSPRTIVSLGLSNLCGKFAKSSIIQPHIARLWSDLIRWCTMGLQKPRIVKIHFRWNPRLRTVPHF